MFEVHAVIKTQALSVSESVEIEAVSQSGKKSL